LNVVVTALRLFGNPTLQNLAQVDGEEAWVCQRANVRRYPHYEIALLARLVQVDTSSRGAIQSLLELVEKALAGPPDEAPSIALAIGRFERSYVPASWQDQIVDLGIALEAALGDDDSRDDLTLRLRTRAAGLLATERDPASEIFDDVGTFYSLRSTIVHGSRQQSKKLRAQVQRVAIVRATSWRGLHLDVLVDRCRDLVRRAILARLALSQGGPPVWPLVGPADIDRLLADDDERAALRQTWRSTLAALGITDSADKAPDLETL
jgi:hypothetical protein